jgi:hypothetical protein
MTAAAPGTVSDAASGGGYGVSTAAKAPAAAPKAAPVKAKPLTLAQQASQLAGQSIAAQVAAYHLQQQQQLAAAQEQARQIQLATQAGATYLSGLGTPTYDTYKDAATTLAGMAGGFTGQLRTDAQTQADKTAADVAAVGGNQGAVNNRASDLANVLYGERGLQPASVLLNSGAAAAARENAVPQGLLGYGADLAAGALATGRQGAAKVDDLIAQAQGQRGDLTTKYLTALSNAKTNAEKLTISQALAQSLIESRGAQAGIDQQNANTAAARANVYAASAADAASTRSFNAQTSRMNANTRAYLAKHPAGKGMTAKEKAQWTGQAAQGAVNAYRGFTSGIVRTPFYTRIVKQTDTPPNDGNGWSTPVYGPDGVTLIGYVDHHPPISMQQALLHAQESGNPLAVAAVLRVYQVGNAGKAKAKADAKATAKATKKAFTPPAWITAPVGG